MSTWTGALKVVASKSKVEEVFERQMGVTCHLYYPANIVSATQEVLVNMKICSADRKSVV